MVTAPRGSGDTSGALIAQTRCPVVVLHSGTAIPAVGAPVVAGVQYGSPCTPVLRAAFGQADSRHVNLVVVHAWQLDASTTVDGIELQGVPAHEAQEREVALLRMGGSRRRSPPTSIAPGGANGVGVEGRPSDGDAPAAGFREAGYRMQSLVVVHGTDYEFLERGHVDRLVAAAHVQNPTVDVRVHVQRGDAADLLVARSAQASLLVLGTRGRHEAAGTILGSTTQSVLRRAACPVMVARDGTLRPARAIPGFAGRTGARASGLSGRRSPGCDGP